MFKKILTLVLFFVSVSIFAQDFNMEDALKMAAPGQHHKLLNDLAGKYKQKIKFNYQGQVIESDGVSNIESILGGRFVTVNVTASMFGMSANSMTVLGYDNRKNKYTLFSIDEMGTYSVSAEGDYDGAKKILTLAGTEDDPMGKTKMDYKFIFDFSNAKEHKMDVVFINPDGSENKMVEITSTRE